MSESSEFAIMAIEVEGQRVVTVNEEGVIIYAEGYDGNKVIEAIRDSLAGPLVVRYREAREREAHGEQTWLTMYGLFISVRSDDDLWKRFGQPVSLTCQCGHGLGSHDGENGCQSFAPDSLDDCGCKQFRVEN